MWKSPAIVLDWQGKQYEIEIYIEHNGRGGVSKLKRDERESIGEQQTKLNEIIMKTQPWHDVEHRNRRGERFEILKYSHKNWIELSVCLEKISVHFKPRIIKWKPSISVIFLFIPFVVVAFINSFLKIFLYTYFWFSFFSSLRCTTK